MPLNLPPEANVAWGKYTEATNKEEKVRLLEEYLKLVPHHKGMGKHLAQCKTKLAKLKSELQAERLATKSRITGERWMVAKEGDAQITLLGVPGSGKSALVNYICEREVTEEGEYPFTTLKPTVGAAYAKGSLLQIVELPGIIENASEGANNGPRIFAQARNSDLIIILIDLHENPINQLNLLLDELNKAKIRINEGNNNFIFNRTGKGGHIIVGAEEFFENGLSGVKDVLNTYKLVNCFAHFTNNTSMEELASYIAMKLSVKRGIILATKGDLPKSKENYSNLLKYVKDHLDESIEVFPVSSKIPVKNPNQLTELFFNQLDLIRVYTKNESGIVAEKPIVLNANSSVQTVAEILGKIYLKHFRFARIWGPSIKFEGQRVGLDHILLEGDQIQIFA
jgi:ribosome-interacting GTPase 1